MGKIFLTSDTHFNHEHLLQYCPETRPFDNVNEMNETIIKNWNDVVSPDDTVYVLGDLFMGKAVDIPDILERLNGKIILIRGNHDTENRIKIFKEYNIEVKDIDYIQYRSKFFILCHFPITTKEFIKMVRNDNSEVCCLYGHVHDKAPKGYHNGTYHVGMDTNDLTPISLEQIWNEFVEATN